MKSEKNLQRALAVLDGWLSVPRTSDGLEGPSKMYCEGYIAAIAKAKAILTEEIEKA